MDHLVLAPRWGPGLALAAALGFVAGTTTGCERLGLDGGGDSDCHPVRKCITLTCRDELAEGRSSEPWKRCVEWCRTSRGIGRSEATFCAEQIGVTCVRDWYGQACVDARQRCKTGVFREDDQGGC